MSRLFHTIYPLNPTFIGIIIAIQVFISGKSHYLNLSIHYLVITVQLVESGTQVSTCHWVL